MEITCLHNIKQMLELEKHYYLSVKYIQLYAVVDNNVNNILEFICENFRNLLELTITSSILSIIPTKIKNLVKLQKLNLSNNKIKIVPKEIGELLDLSELDLEDNQIIELPNSIANLQNLSIIDVKKIKNVYIYNNKMLVLRWKDNIIVPENIIYLNILNAYNIFLDNLPYNIEYLKISHVTKPMHNLPVTLKTLDLDYSEDITMEDIKLPYGCKYIGQKLCNYKL